ncbi:MAG: hypothetical protein AAGE94_05935 [Acidobacteriota bacterium]
MQELTRSMMRFSWAIPLVSVNMMSNLVAPGEGRGPIEATADTLDALSQAAQSQLSPELQRTFDAGVRLQDSVVDAFFGFLPTTGRTTIDPRGGR